MFEKRNIHNKQRKSVFESTNGLTPLKKFMHRPLECPARMVEAWEILSGQKLD